ncbi:MAG: alanine:cation symporter family protein [Rivularia sp. (in: Bacteria)]|nr:alanine:cation symporter family protein [Rivularia sp. MS3]
MWKSLYKRPWLLTLFLCLIPTAVFAADEAAGEPLIQQLDKSFSAFVDAISQVLFFSILGFPLIVLWLIFGAIFFTVRMGFVNFRMFGHAIDIVRGKHDDPNAPGEVSHFQALATALSATVGLGNIAGVAIAISLGGPGAALWMTVGGLLGMSSKLVECTLGQKYRIIKPNGKVAGGPMYYLSEGLGEIGFAPLGNALAILFSICCIFAAFGAANMFQVNQSYATVNQTFPILPWVYGLVLAILVGLVIIGGIHRIGQVAGTIVPVMCVLYVVAALWILLVNLPAIPSAIGTIFQQAFNPQAVGGGIIGVIVQGFKRSTFSNEAGVGSAAIAHSAAKTDRPIKEGLVALLEPFIDTVVICNMTALVIVITGVWNNPEYTSLVEGNKGAALTSIAFGSVISWFPVLLSISVFLFAFSTMISWSYYAERAWEYLFSERSLIVYRTLFVITVFIGAIVKPESVLNFSDATFFAMAFFNLLGMYFLTNKVLEDLNDYQHYLKQPKL